MMLGVGHWWWMITNKASWADKVKAQKKWVTGGGAEGAEGAEGPHEMMGEFLRAQQNRSALINR